MSIEQKPGRYNAITKRSLFACRNARAQRWGQAIVNNFGLKGALADSLFYETDEVVVEKIVQKMIADYQLP